MELKSFKTEFLSFIWKPLLKPQRKPYKIYDKNDNIKVNSFIVKNHFKEEIQCYIYKNNNNNKNINFLENIIIIYLHSHNSDSTECENIWEYVLKYNGILVSFDFRCHGKSGGSNCSLGFFETLDIDSVLDNLKCLFNNNYKFVLWGRSMGAAASIYYTSKNFQNILLKNYNIKLVNFDLIQGIIIDSPYYSIKNSIRNYINNYNRFIPNIAINFIINILKTKFKENWSIAIEDIKPIYYTKFSKNKFIYLLAGSNDELVPLDKLKKLHNSFKNFKINKLKILDSKTHRDSRTIREINDIIFFVMNYFQ